MAFNAIVLTIEFEHDEMKSALHKRRRSISASICLLVVILLYAPLGGAAWTAYQSACCTSGQCPIAAHHHQKAPIAPANHMDCGHDMPGMIACAMSCCHDSDGSLLTSIACAACTMQRNVEAVTVAAIGAGHRPSK